MKMSALEKQIYAVAYVSNVERALREYHREPGSTLAEHERDCAACASENAEGLVLLHRKGLKARR